MSSRTSNALVTTSAGIALACGVIVLGFVYLSPTPGNDPIFTREITEYEVSKEGDLVTYTYKGDRIPNALVPGEELSMRTENSYARVIEIENEGTLKETRTYEGVFYPEATFVQSGGEWYYLEHATTTKAVFDQAREHNFLASLFWQEVYADDIYAGVGDGYAGAFADYDGALGECTIGSIWTNAHDAEGSASNYTSTSAIAYGYTYREIDIELETNYCASEIYRSFVPIVTSAIPSSATITAATLNIYFNTRYTGDNDGSDFMTIVQTTHAGHTTVVDLDYEFCGVVDNPTEGVDVGQRKDITSISTAAYTVYTLNATGLSWIKKSGEASTCTATNGVSCFGIREGHDVTDVATINDGQSGAGYYTSEQTGTSQDPYLAVTYTVAASSAFWQFQDF